MGGEVGWGWAGRGVWCAVWMSVRATLAGVPVKMARETADSGGFPANAAAAAAVVAATGGSGPGGTGGVNMWEPRQGSERGERWSWAWLWLWWNGVLPEV